MEVELGLQYFNVPLWWLPDAIKQQASWIIVANPQLDSDVAASGKSLMLDWYDLHPPYKSEEPYTNTFKTALDLNTVEDAFKTVAVENFWGMPFINEEHYREHIGFEDSLNTTWFGEQMLGYPLYLAENPGATRDQWMDEMFLRMIRGWCNYFKGRGVQVGTWIGASSTVTNWRNKTWLKGIEYYWGWPAFNFIKDNYDFVLLYAYTLDKQFFEEWTAKYFSVIDAYLGRLKKFWLITRIWPWMSAEGLVWNSEAVTSEIHACLDRNIAIFLSYYDTDPPLEESWGLMLDAIATYTPLPTPIPILPIIIGVGTVIVIVIGGIAYYLYRRNKRSK